MAKTLYEETIEAFEWGLRKFERYAHHEMGCSAWGPGAAHRRCSCGVDETVQKAQEFITKLKSASLAPQEGAQV